MSTSTKKTIKSRKSTNFASRRKSSKKILKKGKKILRQGSKRLAHIERVRDFDSMTNSDLLWSAGFPYECLADAVDYTGLSLRQLQRLYNNQCEFHPSTKKLLILKAIGGIAHEKWRGWFVDREGNLYDDTGLSHTQFAIKRYRYLSSINTHKERELNALKHEIEKGLYASRVENKNKLIELANELLEIAGEPKREVRRTA
ncbi:hypothetical protein [Catenovulum agarivorans]|uniref:hypothetical protein n=1 Tax=Catenovulum agarivorans TaxID=1172192 RepID=UPI0002E9431A|nr:hypothetical protein [Catenovulum agarivorans]